MITYRFGDAFELSLARRQLSDGGIEIHIEPQVFDLLAHLLANRTRVVPKEELLDEVWHSRFVSESALTSRVRAARQAIGDDGRTQAMIRTSHGTGYQFVAAATEHPDADDPLDERAANLPTQNNPFHGREGELRDLEVVLGTHRLVTLLGPGGVGKTRTALELGHRLRADRAVTFIDLAAVRHDAAVGEALAAGLGIETGEEADIVDACCAYLRGRPTVLLLDNCEHLTTAALGLASRVLASAPGVSILATSRAPLGHPDERHFRLEPLAIPDAAASLTASEARTNPAVAIFCDKAERARHDFELDEATVRPVVELCQSLDGLPLALELAAGRTGAFSIPDLLERLDRRLDLLGAEVIDGDGRHRTLRTMLSWSYELLNGPTQRLFRHLSVFPGGLTLDAVEWLGHELDVGADPALVLHRLIDSSLVGRAETPSGTRYVQLESMRTFGTALLVENEEWDGALERLASWALAFVVEADDGSRTPDEALWDDRVRREMPNLREARHHLRAAGRTGDLITMSSHLDEWGRLRDVSELWSWCDELRAVAGLEPPAQARVQALGALAAWRRGRIDEAVELAEAALANPQIDAWATSRAKSSLGAARLFQARLDEAAQMWDDRGAVDGYVIDTASAALCRAYAGDPAPALATVLELQRRSPASDWPTEQAWLDYITGEIMSITDEPGTRHLLEAAIERAAMVGASFITGVAGLTLCTSVAAAGDTAEAAARYRELIAHWLRSGTWTQQWTTLRHAALLLADHDPVLTARVLLAADADPDAANIAGNGDDPTAASIDTLLSRLSEAEHADVSVPSPDRAELAEQVRDALLALTD